MTKAEQAWTRILVFMPFGKDAKLASEVLEAAGLPCRICGTPAELETELLAGAGAVLTVEEALPRGIASPLDNFLATQPAWSDLPVLVLTKAGGASPWTTDVYERFGNVTLLEKPVRTTALISATRSALRARSRQYEIRVADQRKDEFLAMLAHELRNPMAPISAAAQMLGTVAADSGKVERCSEIINRQISHMTTLIDDLLDVARVTRGMIDLDKEPIDIGDVLAEAVEQVGPLIKARRHHLVVHQPSSRALTLGDRKRLIQIVVNLLNNAAKYTPEEGELIVEADVTTDEVVLKVSDNGIGMGPDVVERVFDIFTQAERTSDRSQGGLGLGLALVRSLVAAHGGTVTATSAGLGRGSTFTVNLPRLALPALQPAEDRVKPPPRSLRGLRILIVDDNVDAAGALAMLLESLGHEVAIAYEASVALQRMRQDRPAVCLLDIGMPDVDGYELVRLMKAEPGASARTFIAVTGYGQERDRMAALEAGFDHHFVKPLDIDSLVALLARQGSHGTASQRH